MLDSASLSRFTPSRTPPRVLRKLYVQQALLTDSQERIRESVLTGNKHHLLFVGPRGFGKTHLISLLVDWADHNPALREQVRIAWLNEDDTTTSWLKLLLRLHEALGNKYPDEFTTASREAFAELPTQQAAEQLSRLILKQLVPSGSNAVSLGSTGPRPKRSRRRRHATKRATPRTLLVFVENLDAVFEGLGLEGQQRLRAFLQEHPIVSLVATSTRLFGGVQSRKSPFFGFFQIEHLPPLTAEQATQLLSQIAALRQDQTLVSFLNTPTGRGRVRVIHHLAGGNHRVFVSLSQFLTKPLLDELVPAFERLLDELLPYYQERLRWLSAQQRELVEALGRATRPLTVKELANQLFVTQQTASSQLQKLSVSGYVRSHSRGRESLYELAEPLLRMTVETKNHQRESTHQLLEFLRHWFQPTRPSKAVEPQVRRSSRRGPRSRSTIGNNMAETIHRVVQSGWDVNQWREQVSQLLAHSRQSHELSEVGHGLVRSLGLLRGSPLSSEALEQWRGVWQDVSQRLLGGPESELTIPLRLFDAGIRFLQTHDTRVSFDLLSEQRRLLHEVLPESKSDQEAVILSRTAIDN